MLPKLGLAIGFPLVFFLLLEAGLHVLGVGRNTDFFIPDGEPGIYRTNPRFTESFIPASFGLKPLNFRLPKAKPAGSIRVFVIGESAAMGVPEPAFALSPQLQAQLRAARPGRQIEVYNLGVTAINSHAILPIVRQAVGFQPDLFVIYMGNNEVVGPYGTSSIVTGGRTLPLPLIRMSLWVRSTRTGQVLQRMLERVRLGGQNFKDWRGMEMFAGKTVAADDPRLEAVYGNFSANLAEILTLARHAGIRTVLSTVAVNVKDCAPFVSQHPSGWTAPQRQAWQQIHDRAVSAAEVDQPEQAREWLEQALRLDPRYADTHFRLARVMEARNEPAAAREHYLAALQWDALRFRADARINQIIRRAAETASEGVALVDAAKVMGSDAASTAAPAGHGYFFEHVHLTWEGNYALARLLAAPAGAMLFGGNGPAAPGLSSVACADAVGYTDIGRLLMYLAMDELTARPPFTGQSNYAADRTRMSREIAATNAALAAPGTVAAAAARVENALRRDPLNPQLLFHAVAVRMQSGDNSGALALRDRLPALLPPSPEQAVQQAYLLQQLSRAQEAEPILLKAAEAEPYYFQTYGSLAGLWAGTGQLAKALDYFATQVARMPDSRALRLAYAQLLGGNGNWPEAERQWQEVLHLVPDEEAALGPLLDRMQQSGRTAEAVGLMLKAYAYNPRSLANNARLIAVFEDKGDLDQAVKYMRALAASGPVKATLYSDLAANLSRLGRKDEMRHALQQARLAAMAEGDEALLRDVTQQLRQYQPEVR